MSNNRKRVPIVNSNDTSKCLDYFHASTGPKIKTRKRIIYEAEEKLGLEHKVTPKIKVISGGVEIELTQEEYDKLLASKEEVEA